MRPAASMLLVVIPFATAGCRSPQAAPPNMAWIVGGTYLEGELIADTTGLKLVWKECEPLKEYLSLGFYRGRDPF